MQARRQTQRFRYLLSQARIKELKIQIHKELPARTRFNVYEIQYFLKTQGFHLEENDITKITERIYNKRQDFFSLDQLIGIYARINIEEEVEADFRAIFQFFASTQEYLTAQELKAGLARLGETLRDKDINHIFAELDLNYNGYIPFQTFLEAMLRQ